ncbi:hypothetical protein H6G76_36245 [Nostoc sp. FACHB-152]|uniref:hypothetical protein n=1 Tax=unclassified Nostoc TaxID=2593658 RepID=UPI0016873CC3|nr:MULTISPECIES: hypothetical protein [unclassified Nostoc]MBD2452455.1 hypothetical protein [Nostoc sp. FACHB-152]MBD2473365.1 hypothetical protein [Nostoc sp. FACHB-145]
MTKSADIQGNESKVADSRALAPQQVQLTPTILPNREPVPPIDPTSGVESVPFAPSPPISHPK